MVAQGLARQCAVCSVPMLDRRQEIGRTRLLLGLTGVLTAAFFFCWLLIGWLAWVPTMVEVFGVAGMRTPASITVAGLLLAAIAFWDR
jgi:hypothetical protein